MLTRIVHNSPRLCNYVEQLNLKLSKPQHQHILNLADALLVCEDEKTLAALQRQFLEAPDASNWADFWVQSYQAVDKYMVVVLLTWAYVERRFQQERSPQIKTYGDLIRRHRDEHAVEWLTGALRMMQETGDLQLVLQRYLRLESLPT